MSKTAEVCKFIVEQNITDIPQSAVELAKMCIMDCLGVALAATQEPVVKVLKTYLTEVSGRSDSTLWGLHSKASVPEAALVNSALSHALDFDDTSYSLGSHPTAPVLPAALAVGETVDATGGELLAAFLLGFELECKLGSGMNPAHNDQGFHTMSSLGRYGATVAAGKLLKLDVEQMENALAIVTTTVSGLASMIGTMCKPLNSGLAAEAGVRAALLAKSGLNGPKDILVKEGGLCNVFAGRYDVGKIFDFFGRPYDIVQPGVAFKIYPSCSATHAAIDALLNLVQENGITAEQIDTIECGGGEWVQRYLQFPHPTSGYQGKFSMNYVLALASTQRRVGLDDFNDAKVNDPKLQKMMDRISLHTDAGLVRDGLLEAAIVTVRLKSGKLHRKRVDKARGNPENSATEEELLGKFNDCAGRGLPKERVARLKDLLSDLQTLDNVKKITALLS